MNDGLYVDSVWYSCKIDKMKYIEIKTCNDCPHSDHTGAFTKGGAKPCCNHDEIVRTKGNDCFDRVIEYRTDYDRMPPARVPKRIPAWCPLPDLCYNENNVIPEPPEPPLSRIIQEGTTGSCPKCGSTEKLSMGFGRVVGCIQPKCENYWKNKRYKVKL